MNLKYWLIHVFSALMLCVFSSTSAFGDNNSDQSINVDTQQEIYQQTVMLYQAILQYQDSETDLRNISVNLAFTNACSHAVFSFDVARQYFKHAKASVFDTKEKAAVYFGKYQRSTHKISPHIRDDAWTCNLVYGISDPEVAVMTYEKYKRIDRVYRLLTKFQNMALTVKSTEETTKINDHLNYGESCIYYLFGEKNSEAATTLISEAWDGTKSHYRTEEKEKPVPAKDERSCMIFTNVITKDTR